MKILAVSHCVPRPDQTSGELRFYTLLSLLTLRHDVYFCSTARKLDAERDEASDSLRNLGISVESGSVESLFRRVSFDVVFFEFYFVAEVLLDRVRVWQPGARIIVDSVDVHFHRLRSKARLTGHPEDHDTAEATRDRELYVYNNADMVLTVSEEDSRILRQEGLQSDVDVIPNIHEMHNLIPHVWSDRLELIFIGSYKHSPNIDAMLYFCQEVLPILKKKVLSLRLRIVGSSPTDEIKALASEDIEIVGFVPETTSYLLSSDISIAPLRYGGGIKGKIGEAQAHGLPVVTTSVGVEGFGFEIGSDVLIGDTPKAFAESIAALRQDRDLYERIRKNGWKYIDEHFSVRAVDNHIEPIFERITARQVKRISPIKRMTIFILHHLNKHVFWRFKA